MREKKKRVTPLGEAVAGIISFPPSNGFVTSTLSHQEGGKGIMATTVPTRNKDSMLHIFSINLPNTLIKSDAATVFEITVQRFSY